MTAQRMRIPGNNPETKIICDRPMDTYCSDQVWGYNSVEARRTAIHGYGWRRIDGKDYCPAHIPTEGGRA